MKKNTFILLSLVLFSSLFTYTLPAKAALDFDYQYLEQSPPQEIAQGQSTIVWVRIKNTGNKDWVQDVVRLGTANKLDRVSAFMPSSSNAPELINKRTNWISGNRVAMERPTAKVGETIGFGFYIKVPENQPVGIYKEYFRPVADGVTWMKDIGLYWEIKVISSNKNIQQDSIQKNSVPISQVVPQAQASAVDRVLLNVPLFNQLPLSCEATALHMALSYREKSPGQNILIDQIGVDNTPIRKDKNDVIIWGNPNEAFVGNINGKQYVDGYGVYWDRIATVGSLYSKSTAFTNWSLTQILNEVKKGNPVIIWGSVSGGVDSWLTMDGKEIYAVHGEHVRVVRGFDGTPENPTMIYTNDPFYGFINQAPAVFLKFTGWFNNSGVVVY